MSLIVFKPNLTPARPIFYLSEEELNRFTQAWLNYYDSKQKKARRKARGQYFLTFLALRFTGARHGEVLLLRDDRDIDFRNSEITIPTLKQKRPTARVVPVPPQLVAEIARYLAEYPDMKGKVFRLDRFNFRKKFAEIATQTGLDRKKAHPHILRHTRAMELLKAGIPITMVQSLLGHASLNSTAMYLRFSNLEARQLLREKGLI
ncbi:tyrosine-type recombinase/integrase [Thermodesulfovibrio yellowstonii]|jgi:molybdate transport system regulatory protein|uniref:Molybdenum-pterin binding domain protein/site-specific recombinase, phage integrase family n=1 Tax=Thermodesulfovibrio yellowstonii (strain ATCC 51303 / DSM 11347 / YP87) TaxID=289376 RepID=B5YIJ5_THEYD|nr:site-specific integrase [Thermodesulfovibrio yellowstonii]ACI20399.1 molybdenum-pterin binding domain protein/site-specific recombinase, phage integrase family [Thermodesulfovibrio yellowstonii DSM 11347]